LYTSKIELFRFDLLMNKQLDLTGSEYPLICMAATYKGFVCGHKNAGVISHFEITKSGEISLRGQYKIKEDVIIIIIRM
ncbi:MAG: hypothetical protein ACK56F_00815, partial [bacterium]